VAVVAVVALLALNGCGTSKAVKTARRQAEIAYELQKPVIVDTAKENKNKRPEWVFRPMAEDDENVYFSGSFMDGADYPLSVRCANAEALKVAVQSIGSFIRSEFSGYAQGSNRAGDGVSRHVEDGIAMLTKNMHLQGVCQGEVYHEELFSPAVMRPSFNVWVRLRMTRAEYMHAKAEAVRQLRDRFASAGDIEAKRKAESMLESLKKETL
jgi:hypothetical protein